MTMEEAMQEAQKIDHLLEDFFKLKNEIKGKDDKLTSLKAEIIMRAVFTDDCNTAHVTGLKYDATVTKKQTEKWDQNKLKALKDEMGEERFYTLFKIELKPVRKETIKHFIDNNPIIGSAIETARTLSDNSPSVEVEKIKA